MKYENLERKKLKKGENWINSLREEREGYRRGRIKKERGIEKKEITFSIVAGWIVASCATEREKKYVQDQDLFYIVNYDIKLGTTPWTYSLRTYCIVSAVLQKVLLSVAVCIEASCASVKAPVPSRFSYQNLGNIGVGPCRPTLAEPEQDYPDTRNPKQNNLLRNRTARSRAGTESLISGENAESDKN